MSRSNLMPVVLLLSVLLVACQSLSVSSGQPDDAEQPRQLEPLIEIQEDQPTRILFIGNSNTYWNQGLDTHLHAMAASADPSIELETESVTGAGAPLWVLWAESDAPDKIREEQWNAVILQNAGAIHTEQFQAALALFVEEVRKTGAQPMLFAQWDDINDPGSENSLEVSARLDIPVIPTGVAWANAMTQRPDLSLRNDEIEWHASVPGTYLNTAVIFSTLFGQSPRGLPYRPVELLPELESVKESFRREMERRHEQWKITDDDIAFLQQVAWETVLDASMAE